MGMAKREYSVEIPIAGRMAVTVKADSEEDAISRAWRLYHKNGADDFDIEWDAMEQITEGNVCHAPCNEQCATLVKR